MIRRSALRRPTIEQVRAFQHRARRPIARRGRKAKREASSIARFSAEVKARAGGCCQAFDLRHPTICEPGRHVGSGAHHIWPEDRDKGLHDPLRGAWLCTTAHRWVHEHPAAAALVGLLRPETTS